MPPFPPVPQEQANELVSFMLNRGKAFFDTSPLYGLTVAESWLGALLATTPRDQFTVSTKAGYVLPMEAGTTRKWPRSEWTRENMFNSVEGSLQRLHLDRLDIVHLHDPDCCPREALEIALPALAELRAQGVIGAVGAGMNQWQMLAEFARQGDFDCFLLAGRYTLLEQDSLGLLDLCLEKGITMFLGGVYNSGILATGAVQGAVYNYRPAKIEILERVQRIENLCRRYGIPLRAAALQFPLAHPAVRSLVIGVKNKVEYIQALIEVEIPIPLDFWAEMRQEGLIHPDAPVPDSTSNS